MALCTLEKVTPADAAAVMRAAGLQKFAGGWTPENIAKAGEAFRLTTAGGAGVFVVEVKPGGVLFVHGAGAIASRGLTGEGLAVIEALARGAKCSKVRFRTERPGLVKLSKKHGYRIKAFELEKAVK